MNYFMLLSHLIFLEGGKYSTYSKFSSLVSNVFVTRAFFWFIFLIFTPLSTYHLQKKSVEMYVCIYATIDLCMDLLIRSSRRRDVLDPTPPHVFSTRASNALWLPALAELQQRAGTELQQRGAMRQNRRLVFAARQIRMVRSRLDATGSGLC